MKYAICNEIFESWPFDKVCAFAKSLGYHGLEIAPYTIAPHATQISRAKRMDMVEDAMDAGIRIIGLHWLLANVQSERPLYITHPDAQVRRDTADYFVDLVKLCADLHGKIMVIGSPKARNLMPGVTRDQAMQYAAEVFKPCLEHASENGITLALEPLGPKETDFLNTATDGCELIQRINHPNFGLHLDVKAMSSEPTPIPDIIKTCARHLAHFHANDPNLLGPGMGEVKYEPIIQALRDVGYSGYLSVEVFDFKPGAEHIARESIRYMKQVCGDAS